MSESSAVDKIVPKKVRQQRVAAHHQQELLCVMAFQELEWHAVDDVEFEGNVVDIDEVAAKSGDFSVGKGGNAGIVTSRSRLLLVNVMERDEGGEGSKT